MSIYKLKISKNGTKFEWIVINTWFSPSKVIWNPSEDDFKGATQPKSYNETNICHICRAENNITDESILYPKNARRNGICNKHYNRNYQRYDTNSTNNIIKSMRTCRIGDPNNNTDNAKGGLFQKLACTRYGWEDLNIKNDNFITPIDCYDHKTGLFYQIQGRFYNEYYESWNTGGKLYREWNKEFTSMILYCASSDGNTIERIYMFPRREILKRTGITIYKNLIDKNGNPKISWHERYRIIDEEEIKKINKIWKEIKQI